MKSVEVFTDGACKGNPGPGGWGVVLRYDGIERTRYGAEADTTNNRMELLAAIEGLAALTEPCLVKLTTDSRYVIDGINGWIAGWKRNNWRSSTGKPVKNIDLWQRLDAQNQRHTVTWLWVKGHSGHRENEMADQLANQGIDHLRNGG